jgi:hypothetical protein
LKTRIYKVLKTTPPNKMIKCRNGQKNWTKFSQRKKFHIPKKHIKKCQCPWP